MIVGHPVAWSRHGERRTGVVVRIMRHAALVVADDSGAEVVVRLAHIESVRTATSPAEGPNL